MTKSNTLFLPDYGDLDLWLQVRQIRPMHPKVMRAHFLTQDRSIEVLLQRYTVIRREWLEVIRPWPDRATIRITQDSSYFSVITASQSQYFLIDVCVHNA